MADTQFTVAGGWGGSLSTRYGLASRYPDSKEKPAHWPSTSTLSPESVVDTPGPRGSQPPKIPLYGSQVFKSTSLQESSHTRSMALRKTGWECPGRTLCPFLPATEGSLGFWWSLDVHFLLVKPLSLHFCSPGLDLLGKQFLGYCL